MKQISRKILAILLGSVVVLAGLSASGLAAEHSNEWEEVRSSASSMSADMRNSLANAISGGDIETALMAVQAERVSLLDAQLRDELRAMQKTYERIIRLNEAMERLTRFKYSLSRLSDPRVSWEQAQQELEFEDEEMIEFIGVGRPTFIDVPLLEYAIVKVKGLIDSLSNSLQMDMLRQQSLSNKRNEAYDIMTNFIKETQDLKSSIIVNRR